MHGRRVAELASRLLTAAQIPAFVVGHHSSPLLDALRDPHDYGALLVVATENQVEKLARGEGPRSPVVAVCVDDTYPVGHGALYDGVSLACVYRKGAGNTMGLVEDADVIEGARAIGVGFDSPDKSDLGLVEGIIVDRAFLEDRANHALEVSTLDELAEAGWTIPEDLPVVVGAVAVARAFDVPPAVIAGVLTLP
jgi:UDP-N-acetylmuramoylalanine--D-glutamate ligase